MAAPAVKALRAMPFPVQRWIGFPPTHARLRFVQPHGRRPSARRRCGAAWRSLWRRVARAAGLAEDIMPIESYDGVGCRGIPTRVRLLGTDHQGRDRWLAEGHALAGVRRTKQRRPGIVQPRRPQVVSGEPVGYENLLVRENATGAYQLVNVTPPGVTPADAHFQAASADIQPRDLHGDLAPGRRRDLWRRKPVRMGRRRAAAGERAAGRHGGPRIACRGQTWVSLLADEGVVSSDGSHVLFTYGGALYDRIDGQRTVQIDEQQGGPGPRRWRLLQGLPPPTARRSSSSTKASSRPARPRPRANLTCTSACCP